MPSSALSCLKVIDLTQIMAGPFCTLLLADMGAEVIKVEKPGVGDDTRKMGPPFIKDESAAFLSINRNKRSIVIDLKQADGIEIMKTLIETADVLVQNFRPQTLDRLGLGYESVREINPSIVYCSISGFGNTGPYKDKGGFDLIAQGMSGLMSVTGSDGNMPTKVGVPITDLSAGLYAAYGILAAYVHRINTGEGQHVDISLLESGIGYTFWEAAEYFSTGNVPGPKGSAHRLNAPYQAFPTADGFINIGAANQRNWERMCDAIDRQDLLVNELFSDNKQRMNNIDLLVKTLSDTFKARKTIDWQEVLETQGVPCGPILTIDEVFNDPHVISRDMVVETPHPTAGNVKNIGVPIKLSKTPGKVKHSAPILGSSTREILKEHGYQATQIDSYISKNILYE